MKVPDLRMGQALDYLSSTDETAADAKADAERMEFKAKMLKDKVFLMEEGSIAERQARAGIHPLYEQAMDAYFDALKTADAIRNKRTTEALTVEVWRSCNANSRKGNI